MVEHLVRFLKLGKTIDDIPEPMHTAMNMVDAHIYTETNFFHPRVGPERDDTGSPLPPVDSRSLGTIINPYGTLEGYQHYIPELFELLSAFPPTTVGHFSQKLVDVYGKYLRRDTEKDNDWMFVSIKPVFKCTLQRAIFEGLLALHLEDMFVRSPGETLYVMNRQLDSFLASSMRLLDRVK